MRKKRIWVAYEPPADEIDHPEPSLRVVAPADWGRERVEEALRDMGYKVAFLLELPVALRNGLREARFCGVPIGERLMRAWDVIPSSIVILPSGRVITPRRVSCGYSRRVLSVPAYPRSITSAFFYADGGWHVFTILATNIPENLFGEGSYREALGVLLEDFLPRGDYTPIERGFEVEFEGLTKPQAHAVCRLLRELTHKLLRGMLSYRRRTKSPRRPLPQEYLRFLTQEEFQVLQPLLGLD
jgi:hypothetical protein